MPHAGWCLGEEDDGRLLQETVMKAMKNLVSKLVKDEQGGEVLEYALIAGLIIVGAIAAVTTVGTKILARWTSLQNSI
jgi:Flp pilus assembly pilin Flp